MIVMRCPQNPEKEHIYERDEHGWLVLVKCGNQKENVQFTLNDG